MGVSPDSTAACSAAFAAFFAARSAATAASQAATAAATSGLVVEPHNQGLRFAADFNRSAPQDATVLGMGFNGLGESGTCELIACDRLDFQAGSVRNCVHRFLLPDFYRLGRRVRSCFRGSVFDPQSTSIISSVAFVSIHQTKKSFRILVTNWPVRNTGLFVFFACFGPGVTDQVARVTGPYRVGPAGMCLAGGLL